MIKEKQLTPLWEMIKAIDKARSASRFFRWKNKDDENYKKVRRMYNKKCYHKNKDKTKIKKKKAQRSFIENRSGKRYNPIVEKCRYCNKEFVSTQGNNQVFCCIEHKRNYFNEYYKNNGRSKIFKLMVIERRHNVKHDISVTEWNNKVELTKGYCPSCNQFIGIRELTLDHIIPISKVPKGFIYKIDDIQPLCSKCNNSKGNKLLLSKTNRGEVLSSD